MKKKILISLLIVAFLNLITGCGLTKVVTIEPDQVKPGENKIEQLVLNDGNTVKFAPAIGYYSTDGKVTGKLQSGRYVEIPARNIREVVTGDSIMSPSELDKSTGFRISRITVANNINLFFDEDGGKFWPEKTISGFTNAREKISINLNDISSLNVRRYNYVAITLNLLALGLIFFALSKVQMPGDIKFGGLQN